MMRNIAIGTAKTALAAGIVFAIAFAFVSLRPAGDVQESQADVWDLSLFKPTTSQKFASALENLGHEAPRVYDNNGNTMYFSTRVTRKHPRELLLEYQQEFVAQGVNRKMHMHAPEDIERLGPGQQNEALEDRLGSLLTGEIVPLEKTPNYLSMGGSVLHGEPGSIEEVHQRQAAQADRKMGPSMNMLMNAYHSCGGDPDVLERKRDEIRERVESQEMGACPSSSGVCSARERRVQQMQIDGDAVVEAIDEEENLMKRCPGMREAVQTLLAENSFDRQMKGFRSIEAFRDSETNTTSITAVWTDEDFDMRKQMVGKYGTPEELENLDVPVCDRCIPTWNFGGTGDESAYTTTLVETDRTLDDMTGYYRRELLEDGWEQLESDRMMYELFKRAGDPNPGNRRLNFKRDEDYLSVQLRRNEKGRTEITLQTGR